jgi:hypothetical protein
MRGNKTKATLNENVAFVISGTAKAKLRQQVYQVFVGPDLAC